MFGSIVVRLTRVTPGMALVSVFGNTGAPTWFGDRLMLILASWVRSVVLPADSNAFATARKGTRSKNRPALPRMIVRRDSVGDHANPNRGDTLLVSVLIVWRNWRSYRRPAFSVTFGVTFHSSCT